MKDEDEYWDEIAQRDSMSIFAGVCILAVVSFVAFLLILELAKKGLL